jgi:hypothetical protein
MLAAEFTDDMADVGIPAADRRAVGERAAVEKAVFSYAAVRSRC